MPYLKQWKKVLNTGLYLILMFVIAGCETQPVKFTNGEEFSMPFRYSGGFGVGSSVVQNILVLPQGTEIDIVNRAIIMSLQELELSIIKPDLIAGERLEENKPWLSDRMPVNKNWLKTHNETYPEWILPPRHYEIQYQGNYLVERRQFEFNISANLFEKTLAAELREYDQHFSGAFFVEQLKQLIEDNLQTAAKEARGEVQ